MTQKYGVYIKLFGYLSEVRAYLAFYHS